MRKLLMSVIIVTLYCSGCSSKYHLKIDSVPQSAKIICNGKVYALTPVDLYLPEEVIERHKTSSGELDIGQCDIVWASGATTKTPRFYPVYDSGSTVFTAQRPNDHPNAELDYQIDFRNKQIELQNQQLLIQQQQLYEMSKPRYTNCWSDFLGNVHCSSF